MAAAATKAPVLPYDQRDGWRDIKPLPQNDPPNAVASINYLPEYRHAMDAFRYIVSVQEKSQRAIDLTETIIKSNPGMFTVWNYRSDTITSLPDQDLAAELDFMERMIKAHLKGYQVWQHRKRVVLALDDPSRELGFCSRALQIDSKNYHTWAYRHWVLCHFWPSASRVSSTSSPFRSKCSEDDIKQVWDGELRYSESLLADDLRNNSAWAHRFFVAFENDQYDLRSMAQQELQWTWDQISLAPNNASAWNYLRGILKRAQLSFSSQLDRVNSLPSSPTPCALAAEFKADALAEQGQTEEAAELYDALAADMDPIRAPYWNFLKRRLTKQ